MDLTNIKKLYTPDGRELAKLYDNKGRLIWQASPPVLWQGSWQMSTTALRTAIDIAKYPTLLLQFDQTMAFAEVAGSSTSLLITNGMINLPVKDVIATGGAVNIGDRPYRLRVSGNLVLDSNYNLRSAPVLTTIYGITN